MNLKRDVRERIMFTIIPKKKMRADSEPYFKRTVPIIASLFGIHIELIVSVY